MDCDKEELWAAEAEPGFSRFSHSYSSSCSRKCDAQSRSLVESFHQKKIIIIRDRDVKKKKKEKHTKTYQNISFVPVKLIRNSVAVNRGCSAPMVRKLSTRGGRVRCFASNVTRERTNKTGDGEKS
jgi:hypothetical protein